MNLEAVGRLVRQPRFAPHGAAAALAVVPELADGLPVLSVAADGSACILSVSGGPLVARVEKALGHAVAEAAARRAPKAPERDELVTALVALMNEGLTLSPGAGVVPLLEAVRISAATFADPPEAMRASVAAVSAMQPGERAVALSSIAASIQVRLGLACAEVASAGPRVPSLAQAVLGCRLAMLFPPGGIDAARNLTPLLGVTANALPAHVAEVAVAAIRIVVGGVLDRRATGKSTAEDQILLLGPLRPDIADGGLEIALAAVLSDPAALAWLIPALPRFVDARQLVKAKLPEPVVRSLTTLGGAVAAAAALGELARELRRWEVLASVAASVVAVDPASAARMDRALLVPHRPLKAAVVAVGLGRIRSAVASRGATPPAVDRAWADLVRSAPGTVAIDIGVAGLIAFDDPITAFRFALSVEGRFQAGGARPAVAVAYGSILGGTDGATSRLCGPAVDLALRWLPGADAGGPRLSGEAGWLGGDGFAVDESVVQPVTTAWRSRMEPAPPALAARLGIDRVFETDDEVLAFVRIPGRPGGFQVLAYTSSDWDATARSAGDGERTPIQPIRLPVDVGPAPLEDPFAGASEPPALISRSPAAPVPTSASAPRQQDPFATGFESDPFASRPNETSGASAGAAESTPAGDPFLTRSVAPEPQAGASRTPAPPLFTAPGDELEDPFADAPPATEDEPSEGELMEELVNDGAGRSERDPPSSRLSEEAEGSHDPFSGPEDRAPLDGPESLGFALAEEAEAPVPASPSVRPTVTAMDFSFVLQGYAHYIEGDTTIIGRPYGARIVDKHSYASGGDVVSAYRSFLKDKIGEGFVPRTDLIGDLPRGVSVVPLDTDALSRAWRSLA